MLSVNSKEKVWALKYRPEKLSEIILPERLKSQLEEVISSGSSPHLLLSGPPGISKTTSAKAIANELNASVLFINSSLETSVDVIRDKVTQFCTTISAFGSSSRKVVILDECLEENETVRIGTVDNWIPVPLNVLERDKVYPIVSFNMETGEFENDSGTIISDRHDDDMYEVEFEDGTIVKTNGKHPFIIQTDAGYEQLSIEDGLVVGHSVVKMETTPVVISHIRKIDGARVINLAVDKNHTFVTGSGIVTHNCENLSQLALNALRGLLEQFAKTSLFVFTTNYPNKIPDPILSRVNHIQFDFTPEENAELIKASFIRCKAILENEGVEFDQKLLAGVVKNSYPDFRKMLTTLQKGTIGGTLKPIVLQGGDAVYVDLVKYVLDKDWATMRQWVADNVNGFDFQSFYNEFSRQNHGKPILAEASILTAKYDYQASFATSKEITITAFLTELMMAG